jgi:hypothetical protein
LAYRPWAPAERGKPGIYPIPDLGRVGTEKDEDIPNINSINEHHFNVIWFLCPG